MVEEVHTRQSHYMRDLSCSLTPILMVTPKFLVMSQGTLHLVVY